MLQSYSRIKIADNSGAKIISIIRVIGQGKSDAAQIGDLVIGSVKAASAQGQVKKKEIVRAVIVRQKYPFKRPDGTTIRFDDNAAVLISADNSPRGSRIFGPVALELKDKGFRKIISLATEVL
ncbi:MAG: 50S ribosomal protein L14 [Patescibacteria group bacterium]